MTLRSGLVCGLRYCLYEDIERRSMQAAAGLGHLGGKAGDAIAILMRNDIAFLRSPMWHQL